MISSPPRMEIQQSMRRNSSSFYHASATTLFANHGDFFNTHACSRQLSPRACPRQYSWPALGRAKEGQPRLANEAAAIDKDLVTCDDGRLLRKEPDRPFDGRQQRASRFPVVPKRDTQTAASIAVVDPITRKIAG